MHMHSNQFVMRLAAIVGMTMGAIRFRWRESSLFDCRTLRRSTAARRSGMVAAAIIALNLSACVESQVPLLTDAKPLVGQQLQIHLYETFLDGKANDFHASIYNWKDGRYARASGLSRDVTSFVGSCPKRWCKWREQDRSRSALPV